MSATMRYCVSSVSDSDVLVEVSGFEASEGPLRGSFTTICRVDCKMSIRLNGSLGCTKIGVDSSNHWSMLAKSIFTRPARGFAGSGRASWLAKQMTLSIFLERTVIVHCVARICLGFSGCEMFSPGVICKSALRAAK